MAHQACTKVIKEPLCLERAQNPKGKAGGMAAHLPGGVAQAAAGQGGDLEVDDLPVGRQRGLQNGNTSHRVSAGTALALS